MALVYPPFSCLFGGPVFLSHYSFYTDLITPDGEKEIKNYKIGHLKNLLGEDFVRCSKSYIVNKKFIDRISQRDRKIQLKDTDIWIDYDDFVNEEIDKIVRQKKETGELI